MRIIKTKTTYKYEFDNWMDFVNRASDESLNLVVNEDGTPIEKTASHREENRDRGSRFHWSGWDRTFAPSVAHAIGGWVEGANEIKQRFLSINLRAKRVMQETAYSMVGPGTLDMGRYLMGHPEAWLVQQDTEVVTDQISNREGVVRLGINISQNCHIEASTRYNAGALCLSLINVLEQANKRVELYCYMATGRGGKNVQIDVKVKAADDPVNMAIMAYCFADTACFRRLGFQLMEQVPASFRKPINIGYRGSYGSSGDSYHNELDDHYLQGIRMPANIDDTTAVKNWLRSEANKLGVEWDD